MDMNPNGQNNQQNSDDQNGWENARENWDKWQEQEDKKHWDHWDSNASHSSYYNQPTHTPYDQNFSIAALICGILSVTLGCCGLSLPLGALGILFAVLCSRKGKRMNNNCRMGLYLSVFGCIYGVVTVFRQIAVLQDPAYWEQLNQMYKNFYGMDLQEMMQHLTEMAP